MMIVPRSLRFLALAFTVTIDLLICGCGSSKTTVTPPPPAITLTLSAKRASLSIFQMYALSAMTNDSAGVNWTATGGTFTSLSSLSGVSVTYVAPTAAGAYTLTATSASSPSKTATMTAYVTDLPGVFTYHNDDTRDGANTQEYALTTSTVSSATFGKLFSCAVDGAIYTQPLWLSRVKFNGVAHNVILVATQHDSLYAFDADVAPCATLWKANLIDSAHGAGAGEVPVISSGPNTLVGAGYGDIAPEVGVTGTPVIEPATGTLYVVSKSSNAVGTSFYQRLHAIDVISGDERLAGPANIGQNITYPGSGDGGSVVTFNARQQNQRPALALSNGVVYVAWSAHEDNGPYYGWIAGFKASDLSVASVLNVAPDAQAGGIWMGGGAPAFDNKNNLYLITGNAVFDANSSSAPNNDYGDSVLRLSSKLTVGSYFTPTDQASDDANDQDFGAGGSAMVLNLASRALQHLVVGGGKDSFLYLLNGDSLGGSGDTNARQSFSVGHGIFSTAAFWNNNLYIAPAGGQLSAFSFDPAKDLFNAGATSMSVTTFGFPGATPSISASGVTNGIVWALDDTNYCTPQSPACGAAVLHAYDAFNLASELWNSSMAAGDSAGNAVKFTVPTIANGHVYVGTRGNNIGGASGSTSSDGELDVYGLKAN